MVWQAVRFTMTPHHQDDERAEWRVRLPGAGRVVLMFNFEAMLWTGFWEDTGKPLDIVEIRAAAALGHLELEDGRPPPQP